MKTYLAIFALVAMAVMAHPTYYPHVNELNYNETCIENGPAEIYSWHIHVLYWQTSKDSTDGALALRDEFMDRFEHFHLGRICQTEYHQERMCMFNMAGRPVGPWLTAQWSAFIPNEEF